MWTGVHGIVPLPFGETSEDLHRMNRYAKVAVSALPRCPSTAGGRAYVIANEKVWGRGGLRSRGNLLEARERDDLAAVDWVGRGLGKNHGEEVLL